MGSLLSSISTQLAVRSITLGTFFPVVLLAALNILFVGPLVDWPALQKHFEKLATGEDKWSVVALTLIVVAITGILYNLNTPIIRLYEGYPWKDSLIGSFFKARKIKQFLEAKDLQTALRGIGRKLQQAKPRDTALLKIASARQPLAALLNNQFPDRVDLVLPTRFGNVVRSFERYPTIAYGMDAIALWPRLVAKIETNLAASLDETKTSLDFMLHCSFLSLLTGFAVVAIGLTSDTLMTVPNMFSWIWRSILFFVLARVFYEWAIGRAAAWGTQVKSAFDLYRSDLWTKLGYQQKPISFKEEYTLWDSLSDQLLYSFILTSDDQRLPLQDPATKLIEPTDIRIELNRVIENSPGPAIKVCISVQNCDLPSQAADKVTIAETVPEGYTYKLGSAEASGGSCSVLSLKPLTLRLPGLEPGESYTVSYTADGPKS